MLPDRFILVPDILDYASLKPLSEQLISFMKSPSEIVVEGANVKRVSTAALQFLLTVSKQIQLSGGTIVLKNPSEHLSKAVVLLGLQKEYCRYYKGWAT
jgi:anti-anti-sigma regulatory factor